MKDKLYSWYSIFSLVLCCLGQVGRGQNATPTITIISAADISQGWIDKKLPDFSLLDTKGHIVKSEDIKGKVVVFNMWSTTCLPCVEEMAPLSKLVDQYASKDVMFLAPAPELMDKVNAVVARQSFKYTVLPDARPFFKLMALQGYPYHIVVDRAGFIRYMKFGTTNPKTGKSITESDLPAAIDKELN